MGSSSPGDWRSSFGQGLGQGASSHMVAVPGQQAAHSVSGTGANAVSAFALPKISVRNASDLEVTKWRAALTNACALHKLQALVSDGKPPSRDAVKALWKTLDSTALTEKYNECLYQYQMENTLLFYLITPSFDLSGEWEAHDVDFMIRQFHGVGGAADLRDGNGALQWFLKFHDISAPGKQKALRAKLARYKISTDMSQKQLLKLLLEFLATWEKIDDNDRNDPVKIYDYYRKILDIWPDSPYENPIVRTRASLAELYMHESATLDDVAAVIDVTMKAAQVIGVPIGRVSTPQGGGTVLVGGRLSAADNDCEFCATFGCAARADIKKCVMFNKDIKIGPGTDFPRDMQVRYIKGGRAHLVGNPMLKSLKTEKFTVERATPGTTGGKGRGGGGRGGGGRGGGRSAAPIISSSTDESVVFFGDDGENADDFDAWLASISEAQPMAAPLGLSLSSFFGDGDPEAELSDAIRQEIARSSAAAAEAAVAAATPAPSRRDALNPALTPVSAPSAQGQVTPVVRTSLSALRETQADSGGGITLSSSEPRARRPPSSDEAGVTITERLLDGVTTALRQERITGQKLKENARSRAVGWVRAILKVLGLDKLNKFQRALLAFILYCAVWPNTIPLKLLREQFLRQLAIARDTFVSNLAAKAIGLTSAGIFIAMGGNGNNGNNSGSAPVQPVAGRETRSSTPSNRSGTPLSPIREVSAESSAQGLHAEESAERSPAQEDSAEANADVSQWQSGVKPAESANVSPEAEVSDPPLTKTESESINYSDDSQDNGAGVGIKEKTVLMHAMRVKRSKRIGSNFSQSDQIVLANNPVGGIPLNAMLFDNGATVSCFKNSMGRLVGSFIANEEGGISVGDESSLLNSDGSYLHALRIEDADGNVEMVLRRFEDTPSAICNIFSEPEEVYKYGGRFTFTNQGRIWTLSNGHTMRLHMAGNHLAWAKVSPVTDAMQVRRLLSESKTKLIVNVQHALAAAGSETSSQSEFNTSACSEIVTEGTAELDAIASTTSMLPYVDPIFMSCGPSVPMLVSEGSKVMASNSNAVKPDLVTFVSQCFDPPSDHWLSVVQRDIVRETSWRSLPVNDLVAPITNRKRVFVQTNPSVKYPHKQGGSWVAREFAKDLKAKMDELSTIDPGGVTGTLAMMGAQAQMALQRVCTSYEQPSDQATACNVEERLPAIVSLLNARTNGQAKKLIATRFSLLKEKYSNAEWTDLVQQRKTYVESSGRDRPRNAITFAHVAKTCTDPSCELDHSDFSFIDVLIDGKNADEAQAILSLAKAPPSTIGMAKAVPLSGLEILWRTHVILGHAPLQQVLATLAKTKNLRAGVISKEDIETFAKMGCQQCIIWKMKRTPIRSLTDNTRAPPGKKWAYDTLSLKVTTTAGNIYITRFLDDGSGFKRSYGHADFTAKTMQKLIAIHRAFVRPTHGEIWIGKRDNHPSQAAKSFQEMLSVAQIQDQATAPYQHESMPVELTWQHDVPCAMILLATGPGAKALRHFEAAFLTHEDASNRTVKPRAHGGAALSAQMIYYGDDIARVNLLFAFFAPLMYLVFPEVRENKFAEHALPGAYYGPSRSTESDNYCNVWNGSRCFAIHKGNLRIDERGILALSSRTNKVVQPFTKEADADAPTDLPNFDQWISPSIEKPVSSQPIPGVINTELDADISPGDPDPSVPFILFLHAGQRRLGELGHYVKRLSQGKARVVAVDTKRRGYAHNVLLPRVFAWLCRLAALSLCIAILISAPCAPFAPMRLDQSTQGPPVLFNRANPDGVKLSNGDVHPLADAALRLHKQGLDVARVVHKHGGGVMIEHPVNHGANSMWSIKGREEHSTLFDTSLFKSFTKDVPGECVYSDQCAAGAPTRKTTQWYCNAPLVSAAFKYLGVLHCPERETNDHSWPHSKSLVGKNDAGEWNSGGSDEYTPTLSGLLALALTDGHDFSASAPSTSPPASDVFDEFASISSTPSAGPDSELANGGGVGDNENDDNESGGDNVEDGDDGDDGDDNSSNSSTLDDPNEPDHSFKALEEHIFQGVNQSQLPTVAEESEADQSGPEVNTTVNVKLPPDPEDPYPAGTTVQVYWEGDKKWYTGSITKTDVWRGPNGQSKHPRRQIHIKYDDGIDKVHSLHNTRVRTLVDSEGNSGLEELDSAAGTSGSSAGQRDEDMPPSWPPSPVNTPRPQPDPPSQPPSNGTAPAAAPASEDMPPSWPPSPVNTPRPQPDPPSQPPRNGTAPSTSAAGPSPPPAARATPRTANSEGQPAAPDLPAFMPEYLKVISEGGSAPSFVHHGEKVVALPDDVSAPTSDVQAMEYEAALDSYEAFNPTNAAMAVNKSSAEFGIPIDAINQAESGDIGLCKLIAASIKRQADINSHAGSTSNHSQCSKETAEALARNIDPISLISHEFDIEFGKWTKRHIITAVIDGTEHNIDPSDANNWHTPKNEREYLRSPQRAMWRTAKEKKMDQYLELKVFKLVSRKGIEPKKIMGSLWAYKIKFDEKGAFEKLNPRWCVKGYAMDKSTYIGFSEVCLTSSVKILACLRASYPLRDFLFDCGNAFQATRTDDGTVKSEKLYCEQAPGFAVKDADGSTMVCEILVALQGRVDAARLFGDRLEQIVFELGGTRSTWDPKFYLFDFSPLVNTSATLGEVLQSCKKVEATNNAKGRPFGWAAMCVHVDDCPGVSSSNRLTEYIKNGIMVQYECKHGPWKKVLGFKFTCTDDSVTMSAEHTIETMYNTYLANYPKYDARLPGRDVTLTPGELPAEGDPRLPAYKEMQTETRSLLGLLLWVSLAYPQISYHVNRACGFMANPSHAVNMYAKQIALHLYQYPEAVKWGGCTNLELSSPSPPPFTPGSKEYGLHFAADASPGDETRGITGGVGMLAGGALITISSRQHLATADMHSNELLAAGTIVHKIMPLRGLLAECRIPQEKPTPLYIDSASTVFVAQSRGAVKKSAWMRRRTEVLTQAYDLGEIAPIKIEEYNNFADPQTKYLTFKVWKRHLHYTHNFSGEPPPPVDKPGKKGSSAAKVLNAKEKETLFLTVGL